jgi:very-short-patch-repair endonuclease
MMAFLGKTIDYLLHVGTKEETIHYAQHLRKSTTEAEKILWNELKNRKLKGLKFRRQHPIHYYIADFYCHEKRLIIEIDGGIHEHENIQEHDENRTAELERLGITVIRFSNDEVINSKELVLKKIIAII